MSQTTLEIFVSRLYERSYGIFNEAALTVSAGFSKRRGPPFVANSPQCIRKSHAAKILRHFQRSRPHGHRRLLQQWLAPGHRSSVSAATPPGRPPLNDTWHRSGVRETVVKEWGTVGGAADARDGAPSCGGVLVRPTRFAGWTGCGREANSTTRAGHCGPCFGQSASTGSGPFLPAITIGIPGMERWGQSGVWKNEVAWV